MVTIPNNIVRLGPKTGTANSVVHLDSVKLKIPMEAVREIDERSLDVSFRLVDGKLTETGARVKGTSLVPGVKSITVSNGVVVEASAKILRAEYHRLICSDTWELFIRNLNENRVVVLDPNVSYERATFCRLDVTNDLQVVGGVDSYLRALGSCFVSDRFNRDCGYPGTVVFRRRVKTYRERMSFYNKQRELARCRNRDIHRFVNLNDFADTLRCEQSVSNWAILRRKFQVPEPTVRNVLESTARVNYTTFQEIVLRTPSLFELYAPGKQTWSEIEKREGMRSIIELHDYDWLRISETMRLYLGPKTKPSKYRKKYQAMIDRMQNKRTGGMVTDRINVIVELLAG